MEMMRRDRDRHYHHDESSSLLREARQGAHYEATAGERHGYGRRHAHGPLQWGPLLRLASLIAIGAVVAVTVATMVVAFSAQDDSRLYSTKHKTSTSLSENNADDVLRSKADSYLESNDVNKDGRGNTGREGVKQQGTGAMIVGEEKEEVPPNVIFILIDDVGMNDLGPSSTDLSVATPFMDSLAEEGVRISRYYTNHICTPARSSIMTGRDSFRTGMQFEELDNSMPWGVPLDEVTLAERFKAAGYATHMVGKWNLGMYTDDHYPFNRGFDTFLGYMGPEEDYYFHTRSEKFLYEGGGTKSFNDYGYGDADGYIDFATNTTRQGPELKGVYSTSLTAERAIAIANEHQDANEAAGTEDPLFLYLAFQAAHSPMDVPEESLFTDEQLENLALITSESLIRLKFAKIVYFLDIMIERIINELDVIGMMDNTLVVVASDNGGCPATGGSNYPLRGFKHTMFEGGVRTPAIVYSKSDSIIPTEARGTIYDGMMHAMDWTQTLANVTGIPTEEMGKPLSGYDHWSAIIGDRPESSADVRNEVVLGRNSYVFDDDMGEMVYTAEPRGAYIYDGWKINIGDKCTGWFSFNPIDDLLADPQCDVGECPTCTANCVYVNNRNNSFLFHLETDPYEMYNLIDLMPEKFEEMVERWDNATVDEVKSNFLPEDPEAIAMWESFNDWTVAWK